MTTRREFEGGDQVYLRHVQYADSSKLAARARLHVEASTSPISWYRWLTGQVDWTPAGVVVEAGCGPGGLWIEGGSTLPASLRLVLTDQSIGMVDEAVLGVRPTRATVAGVVADVQALPFAGASAAVVVANHMLYHAPSPERGVAELARVLRPEGTALVSTNGAAHLRELTAIVQTVFPHDDDVMSFVDSVFGRESGEPMLRRHFAHVEWRPFDDELICSDPAVVLAYLLSFPPAELGNDSERRALRDAVDAAFAAGDGTMRITKDTGAFVARSPIQRPADGQG